MRQVLKFFKSTNTIILAFAFQVTLNQLQYELISILSPFEIPLRSLGLQDKLNRIHFLHMCMGGYEITMTLPCIKIN